MHTYRVSEAAETLGVSNDTVRRCIEAGVLAIASVTSTNVVVELP